MDFDLPEVRVYPRDRQELPPPSQNPASVSFTSGYSRVRQGRLQWYLAERNRVRRLRIAYRALAAALRPIANGTTTGTLGIGTVRAWIPAAARGDGRFWDLDEKLANLDPGTVDALAPPICHEALCAMGDHRLCTHTGSVSQRPAWLIEPPGQPITRLPRWARHTTPGFVDLHPYVSLMFGVVFALAVGFCLTFILR